jgi:hypothetical protein
MKGCKTLTWGLALGLVTLVGATGALRADDGDGDQKKVEKRRVVVVNKDGKEHVYEGDAWKVKRGFLGVGLTELTPELRKHFGAPEDSGVMVSQVESGSPADKAGLKVGDILTTVDGAAVESSFDIGSRVGKIEDGHQVGLEVYRDGRAQKLTATVVERERPAMDMAPFFVKEFGKGDQMVLRLDGDKLIHLKDGQLLKDKDGKLFNKEWPEGFELSGDGADGKRIEVHRMGSVREAQLEKKLKDLEKRIAELEKELGKKN